MRPLVRWCGILFFLLAILWSMAPIRVALVHA